MAAALEFGCEKCIDHFDRSFCIRMFAGKAEDVGVVMLAGGDGFLNFANVRSADVVEAVSCDAHAHTRGAGKDAEVKCPIGNVTPHDVCVVRIIHGFRAVGAEVFDLMPGFPEMGDDGVLHFKCAMIGADGDADWGIAHCYGDVPGLNAGEARMETGNFGKIQTSALTSI